MSQLYRNALSIIIMANDYLHNLLATFLLSFVTLYWKKRTNFIFFAFFSLYFHLIRTWINFNEIDINTAYVSFPCDSKLFFLSSKYYCYFINGRYHLYIRLVHISLYLLWYWQLYYSVIWIVDDNMAFIVVHMNIY